VTDARLDLDAVVAALAEAAPASIGAAAFPADGTGAEELHQHADAELDHLPPSPARDALRASIAYVVDRRR